VVHKEAQLSDYEFRTSEISLEEEEEGKKYKKKEEK
jgi:hypothetical protein